MCGVSHRCEKNTTGAPSGTCSVPTVGRSALRGMALRSRSTRSGTTDADCLALLGSILGATHKAEAAFGESSLYTGGRATTLMLRDARLPEHLSYMDVYAEGAGGSEGTHWWLGGTAVSLRMSRLLDDPGGTLPHEVINNTYKALLILDHTGTVANWPGGDVPNRSLAGEAVPLFPGGSAASSPARAFAPSSHVYSGDPGFGSSATTCPRRRPSTV